MIKPKNINLKELGGIPIERLSEIIEQTRDSIIGQLREQNINLIINPDCGNETLKTLIKQYFGDVKLCLSPDVEKFLSDKLNKIEKKIEGKRESADIDSCGYILDWCLEIIFKEFEK